MVRCPHPDQVYPLGAAPMAPEALLGKRKLCPLTHASDSDLKQVATLNSMCQLGLSRTSSTCSSCFAAPWLEQCLIGGSPASALQAPAQAVGTHRLATGSVLGSGKRRRVSTCTPLAHTIPAASAPSTAPQWGRTLLVQQQDTLLFTLFLWERVRPQVDTAAIQVMGVLRPLDAVLLTCLWIAAKLQENRRGLPTASTVGLQLCVSRGVVTQLELYLMKLLDWRPFAGWKSDHAMITEQGF
ncbi:hypothetical protein WJX72_009293 [[Myrmecia] bisecta]|uniref:Uncharacterized protein n=1 Tax=[Myrmecia] bisecta TaxID=41462 RepID=A0AAW1Q2V2_9CHLO